LRIVGRSSAARTNWTAGRAPLAGAGAAPEIRLQQMRQCVDITKLAILHAEEMSIGRAAAAVCIAGSKGAERHDGADCRIHNEAAVGDVHTTRYADITTVIGGSFAGVCAAFGAVAWVAPRHQVLFLFKKRVEVGVGGGDQRVTRVAFIGGNNVPL